jgi:hypothetical protein
LLRQGIPGSRCGAASGRQNAVSAGEWSAKIINFQKPRCSAKHILRAMGLVDKIKNIWPNCRSWALIYPSHPGWVKCKCSRRELFASQNLRLVIPECLSAKC